MRFLTRELVLVALGAMISLPAWGQGGGGGFGGGGFGGAPGQGGEEQPEEEQLPDPNELLAGRWQIEFRIEYFSEDPNARGRYLELYADVFLNGDMVEGRIQENDVRGEFRCRWDGIKRCDLGTMRFQGVDRDWQDFGFVIDNYVERATGWAEWYDIDTGAIQRFELRMRKR